MPSPCVGPPNSLGECVSLAALLEGAARAARRSGPSAACAGQAAPDTVAQSVPTLR